VRLAVANTCQSSAASVLDHLLITGGGWLPRFGAWLRLAGRRCTWRRRVAGRRRCGPPKRRPGEQARPRSARWIPLRALGHRGAWPVRTSSTTSRARLRCARPCRARPGRARTRRRQAKSQPERGKSTGTAWRWRRGTSLHRGVSMPRPMGGSPPGAALPPVGCPRTRRQPVADSNAPPVPRLQDDPGPFSPRRAFCRRAKIAVKGASPAAMAQAMPRS
jgi:hypothetical protein